MMKQTIPFTLLILFLSITYSCKTFESQTNTPSVSQQTVAKINGQEVTYDELLVAFTRNSDSSNVNIEELRDFLPSYVDYRIKILEGRSLGYFSNPDILAEYNTFAKEAAKKIWLNSDVEKEILNTFTERSKKELLAYHILITAQNPGYVESREIKNKLNAAKTEILEGAHPDSVNKRYSSVENGNQVGGKLPWITAGRTVESFENVLYSLEVGEVSEPFKTQFGYHIIYLADKRPRTPERLTSHIFVSKQGPDAPRERINQAYDSLKNGTVWNSVVENFSDDKRTASRNGEIGWVGYGMQFPELFVDEVMNTPPDHEFSEIIEMDYGFHIVKIDSVRNFSDTETLQEYASSELNRLGRLQMGEDQLYEMLAQIGNFHVNEKAFDDMADYLIGTTDSLQQSLVIAEFNNSVVTADQFVDFYNQEARQSNDADVTLSSVFEQFKIRLIESNLIEITKNHFEEYRSEMNEFLNGLVVFKVNEEFLWNPDAADQQWLMNHYQANKSNYIRDKTILYQRITASDESQITSARNFLLDNDNIQKMKDHVNGINVTNGEITNTNNQLFQRLDSLKTGELSTIDHQESWHQFYYITKIEPERLKSYEEAKVSVFNELREDHEQNYIRMLRDKYQTELFPDHVK